MEPWLWACIRWAFLLWFMENIFWLFLVLVFQKCATKMFTPKTQFSVQRWKNSKEKMRRQRWQRHRKRYGAVAKSSSIQPCVVVWAEFWPWLYTFLLEKHGVKRTTHSSRGNGHQQPECRIIDTDLPCRIFFRRNTAVPTTAVLSRSVSHSIYAEWISTSKQENSMCKCIWHGNRHYVYVWYFTYVMKSANCIAFKIYD